MLLIYALELRNARVVNADDGRDLRRGLKPEIFCTKKNVKLQLGTVVFLLLVFPTGSTINQLNVPSQPDCDT